MAGEKLARTLQVPLLDLTGTPTLRRLDHLDMPLRDLLAHEILPTRDPGPPPEDLTDHPGQGLHLSWARPWLLTQQTLQLDGETLSLTGPFGQKTLRLEHLEMIREDEPKSTVDFITDQATIKAHLPSSQAAVWLKRRVENYLKVS
jgi:hypothetical protein